MRRCLRPARAISRLRPAPRSRSRAGEGGSNIVEFALVLPLILTITFGLTDLGRAVYDYNTLANAAREGARFGVVQVDSQGLYTPLATPGNAPGTYTASAYANTSTIVGRSARIATTLDLSRLSVTVAAPALVYNAPLNVTVSYPFRTVMTAFVGDFTINLSASSTMLLN